MRLIRDMILRKLEFAKDLDLNHDYLKALWVYNQTLNLCFTFMGLQIPNVAKKNKLFASVMKNPGDQKKINLLKGYVNQDLQIIEIFLEQSIEQEEQLEITEDYYPSGIIGVNIYDRNG